MKRQRRAKRWSPVNEILRTLLKGVASAREIAGYSVWTFWDEEVGETIARSAQPAHFRDGVLVVTVATHSWIQELQFMKESLRDRLNARLGEDVIRDIYFSSGKVKPANPRPQPVMQKLPRGKVVVELPPIDDESIRNALTNILEARARRMKVPAKRRAKPQA